MAKGFAVGKGSRYAPGVEKRIPKPVGPWKGRALCVATAVLLSTSGLFIKSLTQRAGWSGWQVAGMRSLIAGVTLLVLARPKRLLPTGRQWILAMITWPMLLTYVLAQTYTTTANAIFLQYTSPLWVFALSPVLLRERPTREDLLAIPALLAGSGLILSSRLALGYSRFGDLMGIASSFGYAGVVLLLRKWRRGGVVVGLAWGNFILAAIALPVARLGPTGFVTPDLTSGAQILFLGVLQIGLAYFLFQWSLRGITATEASILTLVEPVLCPLWAYLAIGDEPGPRSIIGGAVIVLTIVVHTVFAARRNRREAKA